MLWPSFRAREAGPPQSAIRRFKFALRISYTVFIGPHYRTCSVLFKLFGNCYSRASLNHVCTMKTISPLRAWMLAATPDEHRLLAERAGTSKAYLHHLAAGDTSNYKREPRASLAAAIERETKAMHKASGKRLPVVYRTDLNGVCRGCEFARKCLGEDVVVRSEFQIVEGEQLELPL